MSFAEDLSALGFELVHTSRSGDRYAARGSRYLSLWVHTGADGAATYTWEFELGSYLKDKGFAVSVQDELSLMLFPRADATGPAEAAWVSAQIEATEAQLASIDLLSG